MHPLLRHARLASGLLVAILPVQMVGSSLPTVFPSQTQTNHNNPAPMELEVSHWSAKLKSSDTEERREAAMRLSQLEGDNATSALLSALSDHSPIVRAVAAAGLGERADISVVPALAARLASDKDVFVRKTIAYGLASFTSTERTLALTGALKDKDPEVRGAAAVSLGDHPDPAAISALGAALSDKNPFARAAAARALGVNGQGATQAVSALMKLLASDEDLEVRRQAATALGAIGERSALPALERATRDSDPYLAQAALASIKILQTK
ncbi:MAG TPA: HEAT repeat domain-containing protein [Blastocatellia bacterium]|nr:HEAT repeat domain-containing protein [Blastocatellia bacterium]